MARTGIGCRPAGRHRLSLLIPHNAWQGISVDALDLQAPLHFLARLAQILAADPPGSVLWSSGASGADTSRIDVDVLRYTATRFGLNRPHFACGRAPKTRL